MGGVGVLDGTETEAFVEAGGGGVDGAQTDGTELAGMIEEGDDERAAKTLAARGGTDVDATDAAGLRIVEKGIDVEATNGGEEIVFKAAEEDFSRLVESVFRAGPLVDECIDEMEAFGACLGVECVEAGDWKGDGAEHGKQGTAF